MANIVTIGMVGAGRACELHAYGYHHCHIPVRLKTVLARRKEQIDYRALVSLVGLHETYLNKLLNRFEEKLIKDIPDFLSENWALALYHDKFSQLVINLKAILHEKDIFNIVGEVIGKEKPFDRVDINKILEKVGKRTKAKIEYEIVNFLNDNRNHLPFYHIPYLQPPDDGKETNDEEEKETEEEKEKDEEENNKEENKSKKESRNSSANSKKSNKEEIENQDENDKEAIKEQNN